MAGTTAEAAPAAPLPDEVNESALKKEQAGITGASQANPEAGEAAAWVEGQQFSDDPEAIHQKVQADANEASNASEEQSATPLLKIDHGEGRMFQGTAEQAKRLCPAMAKMSIEHIQRQAARRERAQQKRLAQEAAEQTAAETHRRPVEAVTQKITTTKDSAESQLSVLSQRRVSEATNAESHSEPIASVEAQYLADRARVTFLLDAQRALQSEQFVTEVELPDAVSGTTAPDQNAFSRPVADSLPVVDLVGKYELSDTMDTNSVETRRHDQVEVDTAETGSSELLGEAELQHMTTISLHTNEAPLRVAIVDDIEPAASGDLAELPVPIPVSIAVAKQDMVAKHTLQAAHAEMSSNNRLETDSDQPDRVPSNAVTVSKVELPEEFTLRVSLSEKEEPVKHSIMPLVNALPASAGQELLSAAQTAKPEVAVVAEVLMASIAQASEQLQVLLSAEQTDDAMIELLETQLTDQIQALFETLDIKPDNEVIKTLLQQIKADMLNLPSRTGASQPFIDEFHERESTIRAKAQKALRDLVATYSKHASHLLVQASVN